MSVFVKVSVVLEVAQANFVVWHNCTMTIKVNQSKTK